MKLSDLFKHLRYGELNNLTIGGKMEGAIHPTYTEQVVSLITQGLTDLHTRFDLKRNELILVLHEEVARYTLTSAHALSNDSSTEYYKYIDDLGTYPYEDDLIRIERVYDELGRELVMNITTPNGCTIASPQFNVLQVINPQDENALSIVYKADHRPIQKLLNDGLTPEQIEVELPSSLVQPLCLYVAYLAHASVGTPESVQKSIGKFQQYQLACQNIDTFGTLNQDNFDNLAFYQNGWT